MKVIARNVQTGEVTERDYTQKELDAVAVMAIESANKKKVRDKENDIETKREAAIEELLMSGTTPEAVAYQDAKNG